MVSAPCGNLHGFQWTLHGHLYDQEKKSEENEGENQETIGLVKRFVLPVIRRKDGVRELRQVVSGR
ncbi:MAG: hypothetical protein RLY31_749 [Bacteroidota bacterium]|jgi:hypothetical protein